MASHPAKIGDIIQLWGTGFGPVVPLCGTGLACPSFLSYTIVPPVVLAGNIPAVVTFAGLSPQFVGVNQINVQIPTGIAASNAVDVVRFATGQIRSARATIAVQAN